jgi:hypothetical protein
MSRHLNRFAPSVESLETRETPSSLSTVPAASSDSYYGTGVYKTTDSGKTWTLAPDGTSGRITGIVVDPSDAVPTGVTSEGTIPAADPGVEESRQVRYRMFAIVDRTQLTPTEGDGVYVGAGGDESSQPTIVLLRLANPSLPADASGNVYTVTFGGSL